MQVMKQAQNKRVFGMLASWLVRIKYAYGCNADNFTTRKLHAYILIPGCRRKKTLLLHQAVQTAYDTYTIKHLKGTVLARLLTLMRMEINFFWNKIMLLLIQNTRRDIMGT